MPWKHRTNVGRIVYDEPKKLFRCSDLVRIFEKIAARAEKNPFPGTFQEKRDLSICLFNLAVRMIFRSYRISDPDTQSSMRSVLSRLDQVIELSDDELSDPDVDPGFGGAGATRDF